jgi:hypothetical protein
MDSLFREHSEKILIYIGREQEEDTVENNVSVSMYNPVPIDAIVSDLSFAKVGWSMPGKHASKAKEILVEKKHQALLELSQKIKIGADLYEGFRESGRIQSKVEGDYLRLFCYIEKYD